jgi:uncharacterized protein
MFGRLMPREGKYFDLFNAHAELIVKGGKELTRLIGALVDAPDLAAPHGEAIDEIERAADKITHDTLAQLHTSFITPFDRDEIHELISGMDNILDVIQDVAESMTLYDIHHVPADAKALAAVTEQCCGRVEEVVKLLHSMENAPAISGCATRSTTLSRTPTACCVRRCPRCSGRSRTYVRSSSSRRCTNFSKR